MWSGIEPGPDTDGDVASIPQLAGGSAEIRVVRHLIGAAARSSMPVLVRGETGTGKALVARRIHALSPEAHAPLTAVLCPALEREPTDFRRLVGSAAGGGLLLEEVDEMPLADQEILAEALRAAAVPGGCDLRCFATTRRDLATLARQGRFDADLHDALAGARLELPPLRERRGDIASIADALLVGPYALADRAGEPRELTARALLALVSHDWPGNVRELENVLQRARVLARTGLIEEADVRAALAGPRLHPSTP